MDFLIIVVIFAVGGILLYICITPLQKSQMIRDREKAQAEAWAKARLKEVKEKEERQDALARQKSLEDKFFNSPLTRKIIEAISDGTGRLPEEIVVCRDRVTGRTRGTKRVFDFLAERVDGLEHWADEAALSEAINRILGNEYQLFHGDDELYDHLVVMRLKPTQKF